LAGICIALSVIPDKFLPQRTVIAVKDAVNHSLCCQALGWPTLNYLYELFGRYYGAGLIKYRLNKQAGSAI